MNFLKKTLGNDQSWKKDDRKKISEKSKNTDINKILEGSLGYNPKNKIWNNIDELIEGRAGRKNLDDLEKILVKKIDQCASNNKNFAQMEFKDILMMLVEEYHKHIRFAKNNLTTLSPKVGLRLEVCIQIQKKLQDYLKKTTNSSQKLQNRQDTYNVRIFNQKLKLWISSQQKVQKQQKLKEFDQLVSTVLHKNPNKDFILKYTKEEIKFEKKSSKNNELKQRKNLRKAKSGTSLSGNSIYLNNSTKKGSEGDITAKLQNLLKDVSVKLTKTSIEYDYNAILESSISNIRKRKNVTNPTLVKEQSKVPQKKINKNEGFVFFRPNTHKK